MRETSAELAARPRRRRVASRGRSRSPAGCCRATCATTSTCCTSSSARSTTSSTSGEPDAAERVGRGGGVGGGRAGERPRGRRARRSSRAATRCRARRSRTSAPDARRPRRARRSATEADLDRYCYRVAGTVGRRDGRRAGHARPRARPPRRCRAGHGDAAHEHPARHRRGPRRRAASTSRSETMRALRRIAASPGAARRCCATRSPRADALYESGLRGHRAAARGQRAIAAAAAMYREILRQIERDGYGARPGRAVVPRRAQAARRGDWRMTPRSR